MNVRWKIACINWSSATSPKALAYLMVGGAMCREVYFPTWAEAVRFVDEKRWQAHILHIPVEVYP